MERQRPLPHATVLFTDDDERIRPMFARLLRSKGYEVYEAATVGQALDLLAEFGDKIDIALLNYCLPLGGGQTNAAREVLERARSPVTAETIADAMYVWRLGSQILYIAGRTEPMRHVVRGTRANGCLHKPLSSAKVLAAVARAHRTDLDRNRVDAPLPQQVPSMPLEPWCYREGRYRLCLRLAGLGPYASEFRRNDAELQKVLRLLVTGTSETPPGNHKRSTHGDGATSRAARARHVAGKRPYELCAMAKATFDRTKAQLKELLRVANFEADLTRRLENALVAGEVELWELVGVQHDPYALAARKG